MPICEAGKGVAFVKTKMKNMLDGRTIQNNFRSGDKVGKPDVMDIKMSVLYSDGSAWHFMNNDNFEQIEISNEDLGDRALFLQDGLEVGVVLYNGRPVDIDLPNFIESEIVECEPGVKGDTVQGVTNRRPSLLVRSYKSHYLLNKVRRFA